MRDWKALLIGGSLLLLCGCSDSTAPESTSLVKAAVPKASDDATCHFDSSIGYFVMWGDNGFTPCTP